MLSDILKALIPVAGVPDGTVVRLNKQ